MIKPNRPGAHLANGADERIAADRTPLRRLSLEDSKRFANLIRSLMAECRITSVYALFLEIEYPRATLHRWLSGEVRVPAAAAREITEAFFDHARRLEKSSSLSQLHALVSAAFADQSDVLRLQAELRTRGVRVGRVLDALRAVNILPPIDAEASS